MNNIKIKFKILIVVVILGAVVFAGATFSSVSMKSIATGFSDLIEHSNAAML